MVTILSEKSKSKRSFMDFMDDSKCMFRAFIFLLLANLLLNALVKHLRQNVHDGDGAESMSTFFGQMTKKGREEMRLEVAEVEEIVEKVEEMKKEVQNPPAVEETAEEKKEEVVAEMVEKNLGLEDWCGDCIWLGSRFTCDKRVAWMVARGGTEVAAKESVIKDCSNKKRGLRV